MRTSPAFSGTVFFGDTSNGDGLFALLPLLSVWGLLTRGGVSGNGMRFCSHRDKKSLVGDIASSSQETHRIGNLEKLTDTEKQSIFQ